MRKFILFALLERFIFRIEESKSVRRESVKARKDRKRLDSFKHRRSVRFHKAKLDLILDQFDGATLKKRTMLESISSACRILNSLIQKED